MAPEKRFQFWSFLQGSVIHNELFYMDVEVYEHIESLLLLGKMMTTPAKFRVPLEVDIE